MDPSAMDKAAHRMALAGAWTQVILYLGIAAAAVVASLAIGGMNFSEVDDVKVIISQINQTTQKLSYAVDILSVASSVAIGGLAVFTMALVRFQYRRYWAFWFSILHGGALLLLFPIGTLFGGFLLIYALRHHREFRGKIPVAVLCPETPAGA